MWPGKSVATFSGSLLFWLNVDVCEYFLVGEKFPKFQNKCFELYFLFVPWQSLIIDTVWIYDYDAFLELSVKMYLDAGFQPVGILHEFRYLARHRLGTGVEFSLEAGFQIKLKAASK